MESQELVDGGEGQDWMKEFATSNVKHAGRCGRVPLSIIRNFAAFDIRSNNPDGKTLQRS